MKTPKKRVCSVSFVKYHPKNGVFTVEWITEAVTLHAAKLAAKKIFRLSMNLMTAEWI